MSKSVVRNAQYRRGGLGIRQRHNERQNADYMNDDIIRERAAFNVRYKQSQGSYESQFDKMVADGTISTRGLGQDPFIVDELVFGVNTAYFESGGGYDYAVSFFEEAYRCAVEEIGGEEYVLSAVMHADELGTSEAFSFPLPDLGFLNPFSGGPPAPGPSDAA